LFVAGFGPIVDNANKNSQDPYVSALGLPLKKFACMNNSASILAAPKPPDIPTGSHCINPVVCEFFYRCNRPKPDDYIGYLPRLDATQSNSLRKWGSS